MRPLTPIFLEINIVRHSLYVGNPLDIREESVGESNWICWGLRTVERETSECASAQFIRPGAFQLV